MARTLAAPRPAAAGTRPTAMRPPAVRFLAARPLAVRRIGVVDLAYALREGWRDFLCAPTQLFFLALIYPVVGVLLAAAAAQRDLLMLVWPMTAGFALLGPVAATGLYEISRRRERGDGAGWTDALRVFASPAIGSVLVLGAALLAIFAAWILAARGLIGLDVGPDAPTSLSGVSHLILHTKRGMALLLDGTTVGLVFAAAVLCLTIVSVPLLLDRDVGIVVAVRTSLAAVAHNAGMTALWGALVAGLLLVGSVPLFVGLTIVVPVLGHASWHLYRRLVV